MIHHYGPLVYYKVLQAGRAKQHNTYNKQSMDTHTMVTEAIT